MTFPAGVNMVSTPVGIINNDVVEFTEEFFLDLEIPPAAADKGVTEGSPESATVSITDEDSECCSNVLCSIEYNQCILNLHKCLAKPDSCTIIGPIG